MPPRITAAPSRDVQFTLPGNDRPVRSRVEVIAPFDQACESVNAFCGDSDSSLHTSHLRKGFCPPGEAFVCPQIMTLRMTAYHGDLSQPSGTEKRWLALPMAGF